MNKTFRFSLIFVAALFPLILVGALLLIAHVLNEAGDQSINLPVLAISGIALLLCMLAVVSIVFSLIGIDNPGEALGLPAGSIRAVIALSLIVLFGIFSIYLYSSMAEAVMVKSDPMTKEDAAKFVAGLDKATFFVDVTIPPPARTGTEPSTPTDSAGGAPASSGTPQPATATDRTGAPVPAPGPTDAPAPANGAPTPAAADATAPAPAEMHTIYYKETPSVASTDFAKQLLTILGTLVTAISSFYFGSATASGSGGGAPSGGGKLLAAITSSGPALQSVAPTQGQVGKTVSLTVTGTGLSATSAASLVLDAKNTLQGSGLKQTDTSVTFTVDLTNASPGNWDVVLMSGGNTTSLPKSFAIS